MPSAIRKDDGDYFSAQLHSIYSWGALVVVHCYSVAFQSWTLIMAVALHIDLAYLSVGCGLTQEREGVSSGNTVMKLWKDKSRRKGLCRHTFCLQLEGSRWSICAQGGFRILLSLGKGNGKLSFSLRLFLVVQRRLTREVWRTSIGLTIKVMKVNYRLFCILKWISPCALPNSQLFFRFRLESFK